MAEQKKPQKVEVTTKQELLKALATAKEGEYVFGALQRGTKADLEAFVAKTDDNDSLVWGT